MIINGVEVVGISDRLPINPKYFKSILLNNEIFLSEDKPPINTLVTISLDATVGDIKIINTPIRTSNEGEKLLGKKLLVEINLKYKIQYTSYGREHYIYVLDHQTTKTTFIVLPETINEERIEDLLRKEKIEVRAYVEDIYVEVKNSSTLYTSLSLMVNGKIAN
ncbi:MAG: hypothetical protein ACRCW0_06065 [Clostridium sp.]